ncbi:RNA polymerase sigma factor [Deinococcus roseus]|uniref:RNA polymerase sigma-70 region 2 domain-containing protein n=1 Tax=Deinococcus roseus TaxID=392414 RepID=A0ABQ2D8I4_9DEIO|nr:hypothetical protein [Deinococcus roseus]GGJ47275.1 hypothetical protein GCM10008938_36620 [Deinococcus roseus]
MSASQTNRKNLEVLKPLFDAHASQVLALILHLVKDRKQADVLLEDTFVQVHQQAGELEGKDARQILLRIAHSLCLQEKASRVREIPQADSDEGFAESAGMLPV